MSAANLHIVMPMPSEEFLQEWEQGITKVIGRSYALEVRDPAFMDRAPNPVVAIRTQEGGVIWREGDLW